MRFEFFLDIIWIISIYVTAYKVWHIFLSRHSNVLKDLFNIDVRYYNYNVDASTNSQHEILHMLGSTTMVILMIISPIINTIMYVFVFDMFDIVQFNRILLTITMAKLLWFADIQSKLCTFRPWSNVDQAFLLFQLIFIISNYSNPTVIIPVVFQMVDEMTKMELIVISMSRHYTTLFGSDSALSSRITTIIMIMQNNKNIIRKTYIVILGTILFFSILYSNLKTTSEIIFYYYATLRITQLSYV